MTLRNKYKLYYSIKTISNVYMILLFRYNFLFDFKQKTTDNLYNFLIQQIAVIEKSLVKQGGGTGSTDEDHI